MYKIAVIGDKESILGFSAIGIDVFPVYEAQEAKNTIKSLQEKDYEIIYITEKLSLLIEDELEKYRVQSSPNIVTIPGNTGSMKIGAKQVKEYVKKAIGIDIFFE